jgi:hypothetical protein
VHQAPRQGGRLGRGTYGWEPINDKTTKLVNKDSEVLSTEGRGLRSRLRSSATPAPNLSVAGNSTSNDAIKVISRRAFPQGPSRKTSKAKSRARFPLLGTSRAGSIDDSNLQDLGKPHRTDSEDDKNAESQPAGDSNQYDEDPTRRKRRKASESIGEVPAAKRNKPSKSQNLRRVKEEETEEMAVGPFEDARKSHAARAVSAGQTGDASTPDPLSKQSVKRKADELSAENQATWKRIKKEQEIGVGIDGQGDTTAQAQSNDVLYSGGDGFSNSRTNRKIGDKDEDQQRPKSSKQHSNPKGPKHAALPEGGRGRYDNVDNLDVQSQHSNPDNASLGLTSSEEEDVVYSDDPLEAKTPEGAHQYCKRPSYIEKPGNSRQPTIARGSRHKSSTSWAEPTVQADGLEADAGVRKAHPGKRRETVEDKADVGAEGMPPGFRLAETRRC